MTQKRNNLKKELKSLGLYTNGLKSEVVRERIDHLLDWYVRKATFSKNSFYIMSIMIIVINAGIPILSQSELIYKNILISCMSGIATIVTSLITLFTVKDTWFRYRNHVELIKQECIKCLSGVGNYTNDDREIILIENVESIISDERGLWRGKFKIAEEVSNS